MIEEYVVRSRQNKNVAPTCSGASFGESSMVQYYGDLFAISKAADNGLVVSARPRKVGGMSVCLQVRDWHTPHKQQLGHYKVELNGMSYEGEGRTAIVLRDEPAPWVVHAYNAVAFAKLPPEYSAGSMVSSGMVDVKGKAGSLTGSLWIIRLVKKSSNP